jgi:small subunit ribosomal protein S16
MLKVRLQRTGKTHQPHYRVVVAEASSPRDGKFVAMVGHIHPMEKDVTKKIVLNLPLINDWVSKGAQLTDSVKKYLNSFSKTSDISGFDRLKDIKYTYKKTEFDGMSKEEVKKKKEEKAKADAEYLKQKKASQASAAA